MMAEGQMIHLIHEKASIHFDRFDPMPIDMSVKACQMIIRTQPQAMSVCQDRR
jgi:hypothetical protein